MYRTKKIRPVSLSQTERLCDELREEQQRSNYAAASSFLEAMLDVQLDQDLQSELQDGVLLCQLVNCIKPNTIATIGHKDTPFVKMANISLFLQGAEDVGLQKSELFQTVDLYEGKDMTAVINTILTLARISSMGTPRRRKQPLIARPKEDQPRAHRHVKAIFQHDLLASPPLQTKDLYERADQLRQTFRSLKRQTSPPISPTASISHANRPVTPLRLPATLFPPDKDLHNDSGYGSITYGRHIHSGVTTPTYIMDATTLSDDDDQEALTKGFSKSHHPHYQQPIVRKRFSTASLVSSHPSIISPPSLIRPPLPTPEEENPPSRPRFDTLASLPTSMTITTNDSLTLSTHASNLTNLTRSIPSRCTPSIPRLPRSHSDESMDVKHITRPHLTVRISMKRPGHAKRPTQFLLGDCIGSGQFGSVYRALDMSTGEIVAVKRIVVEDGKLEQEMMKEVDILRGMSCPFIVRYIGFVQDDTYMNIVLEYVENGSLQSTVKAFGKLPEKLVAAYTFKILKGLAYLHEHDVVHCDLKAANILTTKTGDIKLTDFGVSMNLKIKKQSQSQGTPVGTPNWMAPEVIEMKGACTKSDIWSLACTVIELLTGKPPYANLIAMSVLYHIVEDDMPPLPSNISNPLDAFLRRCFQKDPNQRPTAEALLSDPWLASHAAGEILPRIAQPLQNNLNGIQPPPSPTLSSLTIATSTNNTTPNPEDNKDIAKKVMWKTSTSPFGLTTLEPSHPPTSPPPSYPHRVPVHLNQPAPKTKLQRFFGIRKKRSKSPPKSKLYALPATAKSVPNLSYSTKPPTSEWDAPRRHDQHAAFGVSSPHDSECIIS